MLFWRKYEVLPCRTRPLYKSITGAVYGNKRDYKRGSLHKDTMAVTEGWRFRTSFIVGILHACRVAKINHS